MFGRQVVRAHLSRLMSNEKDKSADGQDNSDPQYHTFRSGLPALLGLAAAHLTCSTIASRLVTSSRSKAVFIAAFATVMLLALHGISTFKIYIILGLNYSLAHAPKSSGVSRIWPGALIAGNISILFLNHRYEGYRLGGVHSVLGPLVSPKIPLSSLIL